MPAVDEAMRRSLREGFVDLLVASVRSAVEQRDLGTQISDVKTAFSSWDNCMQAVYCKWPVIALIIIGGLILFSVLWCIGRCLCCGLSCCCECFQCLKCCGECCGCCTPPRNRRHKYLDEPYIPPNQGYKAPEPMSAGAIPTRTEPTVPAFSSPLPAPSIRSAATTAPPQYAEFDISRKGGEDALPEMPSWDGASSKKVALENDGAVELKELNKPASSAQNVPLMSAPGASSPQAVSPGRSPATPSPFGQPQVSPAGSGYFSQDQGTKSLDLNGAAYGSSASSLGVRPGYGRGAGPMGPTSRSPRPYNDGGLGPGPNRGYTQSPATPGGYNSYGASRGITPPVRHGSHNNYGPVAAGPDMQGGYNSYGRSKTVDDYGAQTNRGYGLVPTRSPAPQELAGGGFPADHMTRTPGPQEMPSNSFPPDRMNRTPGPAQGGYGYGNNANYSPGRTITQGPAQRNFSPAPQRNFSPAPQQQGTFSPAPQTSFSPAPQTSFSPAPQTSFSPAPQRQYSNESAQPLNRPSPQPRPYAFELDGASASPSASPNLQNVGGFDFTSGYSRPSVDAPAQREPTHEDHSDIYDSYQQNAPQQQQQQQPEPAVSAYPGKKPYQPSRNF